MDKITQYVVEINCLNYNSQCKYIKNKLLSIDICDIEHIMFFKKLQVILHKLPVYLSETDININEEANNLFNVFFVLDDTSYFIDTTGFITVNYIKLSNNTYQISATVRNVRIPLISYIIVK